MVRSWPPPPVLATLGADDHLTWEPDPSELGGEAWGWRIRARGGGYTWADERWVLTPRVAWPESAEVVEITPANGAGLGRPVRVERPEIAVAEGGD